MEFKGRVDKVMPVQTGTSQKTGNQWMTQEFVFEFFEQESSRYSDKACVKIIKADIIKAAQLKEGDEIICGFGHNVREYQGRFYNEITAYKIEKQNKDGLSF